MIYEPPPVKPSPCLIRLCLLLLFLSCFITVCGGVLGVWVVDGLLRPGGVDVVAPGR